MCGRQPSPPAPPRLRDPEGSFAGPRMSRRGPGGHACPELGFLLRCFLGHAAQRQSLSLCATLGQTPFSPRIFQSSNAECQGFSWMWLLRSTSSSKICGFVVFVYFLFSCVRYLSVALTFKQKLCLEIAFSSAEAVSFVQVLHSW